MKRTILLIFTMGILFLLIPHGATAQYDTKTATLTYSVQKGDVFTYHVSKLDSGFDKSLLDEDLKENDEMKIEVLEDVSGVSGMYITAGSIEYLSTTDTSELFKITYANGTTESTGDPGLIIIPTSASIDGGSTLDTEGVLKAMVSAAPGIEVTKSGNELTMKQNSEDGTFTLVFAFDTGILKSETYIDSNGKQLKIESGGATEDSLLPISIFSVFSALSFVTIISVTRKRNKMTSK